MNALSSSAIALGAVLLSAAAAGAHECDGGREAAVCVENAAARMVVIPEARNNISVTVGGGDARLPDLKVRQDGGTVVVEGGLDRRIDGCGTIGVSWGRGSDRHGLRVMIRGVGPLTVERLPLITARVPLDAKVAASGAVFGSIGRTRSLTLAHAGCGDWTVGDVAGALNLAGHGSGDVQAGSAGSVDAAVAGSGDLSLTRISTLNASVAGSGDVRVREVQGPVAAQISGSGNVKIDGGRSPNVSARIAGSGDLIFGGAAGALAAQIAGSGDVKVAHVTGPVSKSVVGSGDVIVGR